MMPLRIPNREIQDVFRQEIWDFFNQHLDNVFLDDLKNSLWAGETEKATETMNLILQSTLSFYHEFHEYSYHLILAGLFTGMGYKVLSEMETGYGCSDLIVPDPAELRCMILELKHVKERSELLDAVGEAGSQINRKKYESRMRYEGYKIRMKYAMAFCGKECLIRLDD